MNQVMDNRWLRKKMMEVLGGDGTVLDVGRKDLTECWCEIHRKPVRDASCGGCAREPPGTFPAIKALYASDGVESRYCHADAGTRVVDAVFAKMMLSGGLELNAFAGQIARRLWKSASAREYVMPEFGAGYCYMRCVNPYFRVRVARLLGPYPLVKDVLAVIRVVGWAAMVPVEVIEVGNGDGGCAYHMVESKVGGARSWDLVYKMVCIVQDDPRSRVGGDRVEAMSPWWPAYEYEEAVVAGICDHPRVRALMCLLSDAGIRGVGSSAVEVYSVVCHSAAAMPAYHVRGKERVRVLALLGDAVLRTLVARTVYSGASSAADYDAGVRVADNAAIARFLAVDEHLWSCFDFSGLPVTSSVRATYFEAIVGLVSAYFGEKDVVRFLRHVDFPLVIPLERTKIAAYEPSKNDEGADPMDYAAFKRWLKARDEGRLDGDFE
jgi:hypothetical protein